MLSWDEFLLRIDGWAPEGSTKRKMIQLIATILVLEGISVIFLSSKFGYALGILSIAIDSIILVFFPPSIRKAESASAKSPTDRPDTVGIKLVEYLVDRIGGDYVVIAVGALLVVLDISFNTFASTRPDYGDLDTLTIMLGGILMVYPYAVKRFKVEIIFVLLFLVLVVLFLVVPQAVIAIGSAEGSGAGNWYVHYMLAAPFAGALDLMGMHASSHEEWVTFTFNDGTVHTLGISTACAGLYSFSIFVSAFFAFMLVFERLPNRLMAGVLGLGLLAAYLGNLFRMIVIGVVGFYDGMDALLWAHKNVGWMVFLGWSALFWYIVIRYADRRASSRSARNGSGES